MCRYFAEQFYLGLRLGSVSCMSDCKEGIGYDWLNVANFLYEPPTFV